MPIWHALYTKPLHASRKEKMKSASQRFSNVLKEGITPVLKENGFKKKGQNYYKSIGEIGHAVNIQKDKWNSKDEIKFTINLGIFSKKYWLSEFDFDKTQKIPELPKESESLIRERIGQLKYGKDNWYLIESQKSEWKLVKDIKEDLMNYALPFFKELDTTSKLINHLKSNLSEYGNDYRLMIMLAEEGFKGEAEKVYQKLLGNCSEIQIKYIKEKGIKYKLKSKACM